MITETETILPSSGNRYFVSVSFEKIAFNESCSRYNSHC